jgi:hypothetical protein
MQGRIDIRSLCFFNDGGLQSPGQCGRILSQEDSKSNADHKLRARPRIGIDASSLGAVPIALISVL